MYSCVVHLSALNFHTKHGAKNAKNTKNTKIQKKSKKGSFRQTSLHIARCAFAEKDVETRYG